MTECFNPEYKEQLPELAAGALENSAQLEAHVAACDHCSAELAILRAVREAVVPAPYMNVARIVSVIPPAPIPVRKEIPWYRRASLQMAAALVLVAGGLISVRQAGNRAEVAPAVAAAEQAAPPAAISALPVTEPVVQEPTVAHVPAKADIALVAGLDELTTAELSSLLSDVDAFDAVPVAEPEQFSPVSVNENGEG